MLFVTLPKTNSGVLGAEVSLSLLTQTLARPPARGRRMLLRKVTLLEGGPAGSTRRSGSA